MPACDDAIELMIEDIIVDAVGKKRQLCGDDWRVIIPTEVELPTVFGLQIGITQHVTLRTFVHTIGRKLADVGRTEASCHVETHVHLWCQRIDCPHTS